MLNEFEPDIRVRFWAVDGDSDVVIEMVYGVGLGDFEDCRWRVEGMMIVFVGRSDSLLPSASTERHSGQPLTCLQPHNKHDLHSLMKQYLIQ